MIWTLWQRIFKKSVPVVMEQRIPVVGEVWALDNENPFHRNTVRVLDVKRGWVRYGIGTMDYSLPIETFISVYVPEDEETA